MTSGRVRRRLRRVRGGSRSRRSSGWRGCCGRIRSSGRFRVGRWAGGASARALRRCRESDRVRARMARCGCVSASRPMAARPALISSMNGVGPQRYASASRGGSSSASSDAVRRPALSKSRPSTSSGPGGCSTRGCVRSGAKRGASRASAAKEWSRLLRAPCSHQISRSECSVRQCVEHGEDRGGADAGADQQYGRMGPVEDEGAAGRCDLELVADARAGCAGSRWRCRRVRA